MDYLKVKHLLVYRYPTYFYSIVEMRSYSISYNSQKDDSQKVWLESSY